MSAHTPGPWKIGKIGNCVIYSKEGEVIADVYTKNARANTRLIAAAPRMLEALEMIVRGLRGENDLVDTDLLDVARAILRDVEGDSHG